jgi:hypothetical protein
MKNVRSIFVNVGLGVAISLGLVYSSFIVTKCLERLQGKIDIKGYAEFKTTADYASWKVGIVSRNSDLSKAYTLLEENKNILKKFLKESNINESSIETIPIIKESTGDQYSYSQKNEEPNSFKLTQHFVIKTKELEKVKDISLKINKLMEDGIELSNQTPEYLIDTKKLEQIKKDLLISATKNAKERAQQLASAGGIDIGRLMSSRQGVFQITGINSTDVSDYGVYDTSSIEKVVKLVVSLSYATG